MMTTGNTMQRIVFGAERMRPTSAQILALRAHCTRSCLPDHRQNPQELRASGIRNHCSRLNGNRTERFPWIPLPTAKSAEQVTVATILTQRTQSPGKLAQDVTPLVVPAKAGVPAVSSGIPGRVRCSNVIERFRAPRRRSSSLRDAVFSTRPTGE